MSLRRATLLTALALTGSQKTSSCSKTSDGEQDPGGLLSMSKLLSHLSTSFYNQSLDFLHCFHQSLPASCLPISSCVCVQISRQEICHRPSLWSLAPVSMDTGRCRSQMERGPGTMTLRSLSNLLSLFSFFLRLLASICCTTEVIQPFSIFFGRLFCIFFRGWRVFTFFGPAALPQRFVAGP